MFTTYKMSEYRGFSGSYFHIFGLKTEIFSMNLFKYWKIRIRKKNSYLDSFLTVCQRTKFNQKSGKREKVDTLFTMKKTFFQQTFDPFDTSIRFLYPLKTSGKHRCSDVYRRHINVTPAWNGLNQGIQLEILRLKTRSIHVGFD